jgi:hypothetical protein
MASGGSKYFQINPIRREDPNAGARGRAAGEDIGKLLGGLAGAIKGAQKDALANKLMTDESIGEQPGAGVTQDLGKLPADGSDASSGSTAPIDLGTAPIDQTFTNSATGNVEPVQQVPGEDVNQLRQAMVASRLQSSSAPTTSTLSDDDLRRAMAGGPQPAAASTTDGSDFSLRPEDLTASGPANTNTVGSLIHTGGTQELDLQKEMLAQRLQKAQLTKKEAPPDPLDTAIKQAKLAKLQQETTAAGKPKVVKEEKNPPAVNIASEPVIDQNQLNNHIDGIYGKGSANDIAATINEPAMIDDPKNPGQQISNPSAPTVSSDGQSVTVGPKNHRITMPLSQAQIYAKQYNAQQIRQGLAPVRVPGEDQTVGATADNPYPAKTNLDVYSRPPGSWVRLPNGKVAQVPERKQ